MRNISTLTTLLFGTTLLGCTEYDLKESGDGNGGDGPAIEVDPEFIDFGEVGADDDAVVETFVIRSVGTTDLEIDVIEISGSAASSFSILTEELSFKLPTGSEVEIEVAFEPMGANDQIANAIVESDADPAKVPVELLGAGSVPELEITPDPLDFGISYIGCDKENEITLTNVGTDTLEVSNINFEGLDFTLLEDYSLPFELDPEESTILTLGFNPSDETDYTGLLTVDSNEPMGERTADQTGTGQWAAEYTETWEIPTDPPSDIIFSTDQSCSMDDDNLRLANNFSTFIGELSNYSNDWQIIVANGDDGCNNSGILTPKDSMFESIFSSAIQSGGGGWYTEALLTIAKEAVDKTDGGECNNGFMREDAMLHIIVVSDEPEQSIYMGGMAWSDNVQHIIDKKGSDANVRISAIAGDYPSGCSSADAGDGYYQAVAATGGVFLSICGDWATASNLALLAEASINQNNFELGHNPVESTIVVYVNGKEATTGWSYDADSNSVIFDDDATPAEGDEVEVTYAGETTCD